MVSLPGLALAISATALLGDVSYLSSDLLGGRESPSPGLDLAARYISTRFRAAGLEPQLRGRQSKNVLAVLKGSDPELADTFVILSAHYDHLGIKVPCDGSHCIFPGANDDASGVASVLAIAADLAARPVEPRRSIVFAAFYGEEKGFAGSWEYVNNPLVPLDKTVAVIELEQLGRTDDSRGPQIRRAAITGYGLSSVGAAFAAAGAPLGIKFYSPPHSRAYFERSDNLPFAKSGIPAHSVAVALDFPDYHQPGDQWQKIDYANMAEVVLAIEAGVVSIANETEPPHWTNRLPGGHITRVPPD
jgi:Zn-dependent M28 family amino/carboxypeptidase